MNLEIIEDLTRKSNEKRKKVTYNIKLRKKKFPTTLRLVCDPL